MQSACSSLLLGARAHVSRCVTWAGKMALEYAAEMGETELLRLLDPTGANGGAVPAARREANPTRSESVDLAASTSRRFHSTPSRPGRSRGWMRTSRPPSSSAPSTAGCAARCLSFPNLAKSRQASGHQGGPADFYIVVEGALECFVAAEGAAAVRQGTRRHMGRAPPLASSPSCIAARARRPSSHAPSACSMRPSRDVFREFELPKCLHQRMRFEQVVACNPRFDSLSECGRLNLPTP